MTELDRDLWIPWPDETDEALADERRAIAAARRRFDPQTATAPDGPGRCEDCHELSDARHACACDAPN